jgi:ubiquinone/menaquinone biosynthesis C-methylase UbiE
MNDKDVEKYRYDGRAKKLLGLKNYEILRQDPRYLQPAVSSYRSLLEQISPGSKVLEIGAGMGEHTEMLLELGLVVCATDISTKSVEILVDRFADRPFFSAETADMESLPFGDNTFNVVCSAGSLSYGDNSLVMNEIHRVLDNGGAFIALDSLSNNPIYKLNRYLHFLRGNRSKSTLERMPTVDLINSYAVKFGNMDVAYFGSLTWLFPILTKFFSDESIEAISNRFDTIISVKKSAFKFTMKVTKL